MKVTGVGIEIDVSLTPEEIISLGKEDIPGIARMWGVNEEQTREIPFVISSHVDSKHVSFLKTNRCYCSTEGHDYLPHARKILFHIGPEMYSELLARRFTVSRFSSGGKIKLFDSTRKDEVYR